MRESRVRAEPSAQLLPRDPLDREVRRLRKEDEVRIPDVHHCPRNLRHACHRERSRHHPRHAHAALNAEQRARSLHHAAAPRTTVRSEYHVVTPFARGKPRRHTSRSIARELRLRPVRIEQTQEQLTAGASLQELDPVRANARRPRTQPPRQCRMTPSRIAFIHDQEVIPAGVRLHERPR